jgi:putative nucleotidyltransferase with HDIG domain
MITPEEIRTKTEIALKNIYSLPAMPQVMTEALKCLNAKPVITNELTKVVSKDQGLILRILGIANSPMYGLQRRVTSLDYAVLILGINEIRNIITMLSVTESLKNKTDKFLDNKQFWLHSFITGSIAKKIAAELGYLNPGEAFVGGFMHDIGIAVMHRYFHSGFIRMTELAAHSVPVIEAEKLVLGIDHCEIGHKLLEKWNFPAVLCNSILYHHNPSKCPEDSRALASVIHLADYITYIIGAGSCSNDKGLLLDEEPVSSLKLFPVNSGPAEYAASYREEIEDQIKSVRY